MRERREQRKFTLSELKQIRRVEECKHAQLPSVEPYETPRLVTHKKKGTGKDVSFPSLVGDTNFLQIGPSGAEAAVTGTGKTSNSRKFSVDEFVQKHSKNFEIWSSPSAKNSVDMKGMFIVIGEHHYEPEIGRVVKKVMLEFRRTRGDRFFMEGGVGAICEERTEKYTMQSGDCRLLEEDCPAFWYLKELGDLTSRKVLECVAYLRKHVPSAQEQLTAENIFAYIEFVKRHSPGLPSSAIPGYKILRAEASKIDVHATKEAERLRPERDAHMVRGLLEKLTETAVNYVIVGSDHLKSLRDLLTHRRCIFMVPRLIVEKEPSASLFADLKDEL